MFGISTAASWHHPASLWTKRGIFTTTSSLTVLVPLSSISNGTMFEKKSERKESISDDVSSQLQLVGIALLLWGQNRGR